MNKQDIIDLLNAAGITFDPSQTKAELAALLPSTAGKPGGEAASTGTTGEPPAEEAEKPAEDKPAEVPPADAPPVVDPPAPDAPQAETLPFPSPEKPAEDKPAEVPPADAPPVVDSPAPDAPQAETLPFPSPFPKLIPDEEWNTAMQADFEAMLAEKISAGLSREQALEVIERQIDWDLHGTP